MTEEQKQALIEVQRYSVSGCWIVADEGGRLVTYEAFLALAQRAEEAEAKLAELAKQNPVAEVNHDGTFYGFKALENMPEGNYQLFTRPAPAVSLAEVVPDEWGERVYSDEEHGYECGWNDCRAAILRNIEEAQ